MAAHKINRVVTPVSTAERERRVLDIVESGAYRRHLLVPPHRNKRHERLHTQGFQEIYCDKHLCTSCEKVLQILLLWRAATGEPSERRAQIMYTMNSVAANTGLRGELLLIRVLRDLRLQQKNACVQ